MKVVALFSLMSALLLGSGCTTTRAGKGSGSVRTPGAAVKSAVAKEATIRDKAKYIYPGLTLGDANRLFGWKADFRAGNWYWTDTGTLLVQAALSQDIESDPRIIEVFDFNRNLRMQWDMETQSILVSPLPRIGRGPDEP